MPVIQPRKTRATRYLQASDVDTLARMVDALLTELWITRDRVAVLEQLLEEKGSIEPGVIDRYQPDGEFAERLERLRDAVVSSVVGAPFSDDSRSVDSLKKRL